MKKEAWDRQEGERSRSYQKFCIYRDLGPTRNMKRARLIWNERFGETLKKRNHEQLAMNYDWYKRASKYDDYLDSLTREVNEKDIIEMTQRHASESKLMQARALQICFHPDMDSEKIELSKKAWILQVSGKAYKELALLERLSRGEATDKISKEDDGLKQIAKALEETENALEKKDK